MKIWNEWIKEEYSIVDIQLSYDSDITIGGMGWLTIKDVLDRMERLGMTTINRSRMRESERECVEKAMYHIYNK